MAEKASTPPLPQQTVQVEFDPRTFELRAAPETLYLLPGSLVFWDFRNVPEGFFPWIRFDVSRASHFGPFPAVSQLATTLVASLPLGAPAGKLHYRVLLRSRIGGSSEAGHATLWSRQLGLEILADSGNLAKATQPAVGVTTAGSSLAIAPDTVVLTSAQDVMVGFHFAANILADAAGPLEPHIQFTEFTPDNAPVEKSPPLGPFTSLIFDGSTIWGSGDSGRRGRYAYQALAIRSTTGELVWASSADPVIDDQREPPP